MASCNNDFLCTLLYAHYIFELRDEEIIAEEITTVKYTTYAVYTLFHCHLSQVYYKPT